MSTEDEKVASLKNAVQWVKNSPNADTVFALAVVARSVMSMGSGLSFNQVKEVIDKVYNAGMVIVTTTEHSDECQGFHCSRCGSCDLQCICYAR